MVHSDGALSSGGGCLQQLLCSMAASMVPEDCPFALLYQGLPAVCTGEFMETAGRCAWTLRLPDAQPRMNSAVSASVYLREGFKWGSTARKTAPVFAKALPISADYQSVPFKHVGVSVFEMHENI